MNGRHSLEISVRPRIVAQEKIWRRDVSYNRAYEWIPLWEVRKSEFILFSFVPKIFSSSYCAGKLFLWISFCLNLFTHFAHKRLGFKLLLLGSIRLFWGIHVYKLKDNDGRRDFNNSFLLQYPAKELHFSSNNLFPT